MSESPLLLHNGYGDLLTVGEQDTYWLHCGERMAFNEWLRRKFPCALLHIVPNEPRFSAEQTIAYLERVANLLLVRVFGQHSRNHDAIIILILEEGGCTRFHAHGVIFLPANKVSRLQEVFQDVVEESLAKYRAKAPLPTFLATGKDAPSGQVDLLATEESQEKAVSYVTKKWTHYQKYAPERVVLVGRRQPD